MGAKGSYLSPLFAAEFAAHLEEGKSLDSEVDISRYYSYYEEKA